MKIIQRIWADPASRRGILCAGAFLLLSFLYCRFLLPETAVWITDNGSKYIMLHTFAETGSVQIKYPVPELFPRAGFHFLRRGDKFVPFLSPVLPQITLPWFYMAGDFGAHFWPWLAGAGILLLLARYGRGKWVALLALGATPLLFYSQLFWEMAPAAFLASAGLFLLFGRRPAWGGFLLGAGLWMREELYVAGIAAAVVLILERDWKTLLRGTLGALLPVFALWARNISCDGHILGIHGAMYRVNNRPQEAAGLFNFLRETGSNFYQHLFRFASRGSGVPGAVLAILLIIAGWVKNQRVKFLIAALFALWTAVVTVMLFFHPSPLYLSAQTAGLIPSLPAAAGFFLFGRALLLSPKRSIRLLSRCCVLVIVMIPFLLSPHDIGLTWGARHYCVIMPVLVMLSWHAFRTAEWIHGKKALLVWSFALISLGMQFYAMLAQVRVTRETAALDQALCAMPEKIVLSDAFYLPEETPCAFGKKLFLSIASPEQAEQAALLPSGTKFILAVDPKFRVLSAEAMKNLMKNVRIPAPPQSFKIGGAMEVYLFRCVK